MNIYANVLDVQIQLCRLANHLIENDMLKKVINMPTQYTANMLIIYANMNFVVAMASILIPVDLL